MITIAGKKKAIVEPVWAVEPELDSLGMQAVASPVGRSRNLTRTFLGERSDSLVEFFTAAEDSALIGDGCADLAGAGPAVEVCVDVLRVEFRH